MRLRNVTLVALAATLSLGMALEAEVEPTGRVYNKAETKKAPAVKATPKAATPDVAVVAPPATPATATTTPATATTPAVTEEAAATTKAGTAGTCQKYVEGEAELVLCIREQKDAGANIKLVDGFLYNSGAKALCGVKLAPEGVEGKIQSFWPDWAGNSTYEMYFNAGQVSDTGVTIVVDQDTKTYPTIAVTGFKVCGGTDAFGPATKAKTIPLDDVKLPEKKGDNNVEAVAVPVVAGNKQVETAPCPGSLKVKDEEGGAPPAAPAGAVTVTPDAAAPADEDDDDEGTGPKPLVGVEVASDSTDYDHCKAFKGADAGSEVTLCLKNAKAWNDKKRGRIVQTNLVMINTGEVGLCNITVHMDNIDKEIGDHYPEIIDEWAFDTFPRFSSYYAPQRVTHLGASIPKAKGVPAYSILNNMKACTEADGALLRRPFKCSESNRNGGSVKICVYSDLKAWTDDDGKRMVGVEGFISNVGDKPACNVNVNIQDLGKATEVQGDWMPLYKGTLVPKTWLKFGASIPFEEGWPKVSLKKYEVCAKPGADDEDDDEDAPAKPAKKAAPALRG